MTVPKIRVTLVGMTYPFGMTPTTRIDRPFPPFYVPRVSDLAYIALGSNLGDRLGFLQQARAAIAGIANCRIVAETRVDETEPLGGLEQPPYLNQMLAVETTLDPHTLLDHLQRIEAHSGRERTSKWSSRTLDLDIVRFDDRVVRTATLTIPHPGLADRPFWQREVAELDEILNRTTDD